MINWNLSKIKIRYDCECSTQFLNYSDLWYTFLHNSWCLGKCFLSKHNRLMCHAQHCSFYMVYVTNAYIWSKWINDGLKTVPSPPHQHSLVLLTCATSRHFIHQAGQPFALARSHFHHFTLHACFLSHLLIESTLRQLGVGMDGNTHQQSPWKQSWGNKGT